MPDSAQHLLFALLRRGLGEKTELPAAYFGPADENGKAFLLPELTASLYALSKKNDLAAMVADVLAEDGLLAESDPTAQKFRKRRFYAIARCEQMTYVLNEICRIFGDKRIPHIPLKGAVLRTLYPQPFFRTSSDIDVLVHPEDIDAATAALEAAGYAFVDKSAHEVIFNSVDDIHVELHFTLIEDFKLPQAAAVLDGVWDHATVTEGFTYALSDAMFCFYHVAHMAKHILLGGCGVRFYLDLHILDMRGKKDPAGREALLREGGLFTFAETVEAVAAGWFDGTPLTEAAARLAAYSLDSGMYADRENFVAIRREGTKRSGYILRRLFPPFAVMKTTFPRLARHKWLLPFYYVYRFFHHLGREGVKATSKEIKTNSEIDETRVKAVSALLSELDLK